MNFEEIFREASDAQQKGLWHYAILMWSKVQIMCIDNVQKAMIKKYIKDCQKEIA